MLQRDLTEVGLRHDEHVGDLHDPGLQELQDVAAARLHDDGDRVGDVGDLGLGLADADRLDHDDVERRRERVRGGTRRPRQPAEALAGGGRADEHVAVRRIELDRARGRRAAIRPSGASWGRRRASRRCGPSARQARNSAESSVDLPAPGGPVIADDVPRRLAAERGGGDLAQQRRGLLAVAGGGALEQVQRRRRGAQVPFAQARAERGADPVLRPRCPAHAAPLAEEPLPATATGAAATAPSPPAPSAPTSSTMSRMMRVMSKSFGV